MSNLQIALLAFQLITLLISIGLLFVGGWVLVRSAEVRGLRVGLDQLEDKLTSQRARENRRSSAKGGSRRSTGTDTGDVETPAENYSLPGSGSGQDSDRIKAEIERRFIRGNAAG